MKVFVQFLLLSILFCFCASAAFADDVTPAEEEVCDFLQGPEFSPGLFGLCNAYCEAKDCDELGPLEDQPWSCQRLYSNFVNTATGEDPLEPPCLEEESEPLVPPCACWPDDEDNNGIPDALEPPLLNSGAGWDGGCVFDEQDGFYSAGMVDAAGLSFLVVSEGMARCEYMHVPDPAIIAILEPITEDQLSDCKEGIRYLKDVYFPATCSVIP